MPSNHHSPGTVEKIAALIGRRAGPGPDAGEAGGDFDAIMRRLDSGIAVYREDMAQRQESPNRRAS